MKKWLYFSTLIMAVLISIIISNEVSTPMRCIAPMDVVSKAELRSENTH